MWIWGIIDASRMRMRIATAGNAATRMTVLRNEESFFGGWRTQLASPSALERSNEGTESTDTN